MEMTGEYLIPAPRAKVWEALNDINVLKAAVPGCESMTAKGDQIEATVTAKVGPVKATFSGIVTLSDLDPPNSYNIRGEGKGGVAGFARGGARVTLTDAPGGTLLSYKVDAAVGGKLAQIGSRLIDSTAKKLADEFFAAFSIAAAGPAAVAAAAPPPLVVPSPPPAPVVTVTPEAPHKRDALADFKPITFGKWIITLVVVVAAVGVISVIW
jgi:carbon monoxide dehydrogenase subunit G